MPDGTSIVEFCLTFNDLPMHVEDFDFELPPELIAQNPLAERSSSRMLTVDRQAAEISDRNFCEIGRFLKAGDVLVLNNTRVFPARLLGNTDTGAAVEIFLVRDSGRNVWEVLARPARRLREGKRILFGPDLSGTVVGKLPDGKVLIELESELDLFDAFDRVGSAPLPPYIKRPEGARDSDRERYQTVFAKNRGAIAAPTAGLHFTPDLLDELRGSGVETVEITLHVGYGTFEPVRVENIADHRVASERYFIDDAAASQLNKALVDGRRIVAVGTTSTRTLESAMHEFGRFAAGEFTAALTITPGYRFRAVSALLTNFHLPKSSLLILTSTFGRHELIMNAYRHAVDEQYRFYSYGDCMFIF